MTIELSDEQFDRLIEMVAANKVAVLTAMSELRLELTEKLDNLKIGQGLVHASLGVIEEDIGKIQAEQREHAQALGGLTELCSTNFDLIESLNKHVHGESSTIGHDAAIRGTRPQ